MKLRLLALTLLITLTTFSQSFHDTQGKLDISSSGQATYTLPIAMPPSIKDVGPIINLNYASSQVGGIAGQGWNINSISTISRIATRQDIDGFKDGVDFDDNDKLALDGQRLLLKTGTYWADGSTYETEVQSNTKIELKGTGTATYFIVTQPDGSRTYYGNYGGYNAADLSAYYVTRFEDTNGNFMTYHYIAAANSTNAIFISEIRFSANNVTNTTPLNKIVFTYKAANRGENAYLKGLFIIKKDILDKIEVFTNSLLFKKYQLTHVTDAQGYDRVSQLQEFNGALEAANPVVFEYSTTSNNVIENTNTYTDVFNINSSPDMSGDFDGDGRLDFISGNKLYTKLFQGGGSLFDVPFGGYSRQKFTATTLTNNKVNQKQSMVFADEKIDKIEFKVYNLDGAGVTNTYNKIINKDNSGSCSDICTQMQYDLNGNVLVGPGYPASKCTSPTFLKNSNKYLEGDFNGDNVSEVLVLSYQESKTIEVNTDPNAVNLDPSEFDTPGSPSQPACKYKRYTSDFIAEARLVDLNPNSTTADNTAGNFALTNADLLQGDKRYVMDMNSDGKADIFIINNNKTYKVIGFKQLTVAPWMSLEVIGEGIIDQYTATKQLLFGDYNGDGKPDLMIPDADNNGCNGCNGWNIYYGNPKPTGGESFSKNNSKQYIVDYIPNSGTTYETQKHSNSYYAIDVNKDGKSDMVRIKTILYQPDTFFDPKNTDSAWEVSTFINNLGSGVYAPSNSFSPEYVSPTTHNSDDPARPVALVSNYKYRGLDSELLIFRYHGSSGFEKKITYLDFKKDFNQDNFLSKVTQSGGAIVDEITYASMEPDPGSLNMLGNPNGFYSSGESLAFPLIEMKQLVNNKLVYKLKNTSLGIVKSQVFRYHGFALHLGGLGAMGFKKTARSSWYKDDLEKVIWSVSENNPMQRGAALKTYSQLIAGAANFSFADPSTGLLAKTENVYTESTDAVSKRYAMLLNKQSSTNYLTNIVNETVYNNYTSDYLLPTSVTKNNYLGTSLQGTSTTTTTYNNAPTGVGSSYYIGRPTEVNTTTTAYGNTQSSNEKYFYTNGNLTKTEKKANNAPETVVETLGYYSTGLLKTKTISATGTSAANAVSPRSTTYTYDPSNRFVKTITNAEGLVTTNMTYHGLYGTVLSQTNAFNQTTTSLIDNWGKPTKVTDFLGKSIVYGYSKANGLYTTTQTGDDGSASMTESDALARLVRKGSKDLNGSWNYMNTEYDYLGKKTRESEPYSAAGSATQWTTYTYDEYARPVKTTLHTGKETNTVYNGLIITAYDVLMSKSKTMNANGHVVSATDTPGGTILYTYDALGNLLESNYDGIKTTVEYDLWGRKKKLVETSSGTYTYTYNAYGETLSEGTPKGTTTYTLDPLGKVITKAIVGNTAAESTNITSTYTYDPVYKWVTNMAVANVYDGPSNYAYSYDTVTKQLNKTIETFGPVSFTKALTFDAFGRTETETTTAVAHGKSTSKTIKTAYKNGMPWQLLDGTSVLWQANTVNARGQITGAALGNGIAITNTYDAYGYTTQNKHLKGTLNVMTLDNVFEPKLGNLTSRYNSMFDIKEAFTFDNLDRLTTWTATGDVMLNHTFTTSTEGFTAAGPNASINNNNGKLTINAYDAYNGAEKLVLSNCNIGKSIKIKADFAKIGGNSNAHLVVVEKDPITGDMLEQDMGGLNNGLVLYEYTTQSYPDLYIKFSIDNVINGTNVLVNPDGSPQLPSAIFTIDNLIIYNITTQTQNYDDRGRITNSDVGNYAYSNTAKPYQNTAIVLNNEAADYYKRQDAIYTEGMEAQTGWDSSVFPQWSFANGFNVKYDTTQKHSGNYALKLTTTPTDVENYIHTNREIPINNAVATAYTYSGWAYSNGPVARIGLFMRTATETYYYTLLDSSPNYVKNQWVYIEKTFTVPANIKKLNIRLDAYYGTGDVWYDDIKIVKTGDINAPKQLDITYTAFKSPVQIEEVGIDKISFVYNAMQQRQVMYYGSTNSDKLLRPYRKYYSADGSMEVKYTVGSNTVEMITYIGGTAYTAPLVLKGDGVATPSYYYLHRDYQGSIMAVTNSVGAVVEKRLFDAWGSIAKIQDGAGNNLNQLTFFDRGYTGHEHLQSVGLINMNARLYDPKLHRFLQPDNFVQDPYNTQNYNRYGYCINNPLKYTDITGNVFGIDDAIIIGAAVGLASYFAMAIINDTPITLKGALMASFIGAVSGAVTFGIGSWTNSVANFYVKAAYQALAHGTFQGTLSGIQGGGFWVGFASGSLASIASSAFKGGGVNSNYHGAGKFADSTAGVLAFGSIAGGVGASLTGGNFWQGAVTGLIVSGLNHAAHAMMKPKTTVAGIYGAGGDDASGNPALKKLVEAQGGKMFTSTTPLDSVNGDDEIIAYLKAGFESGNDLKIYGHSRGGAAAVRIANALGAMHINVAEINLYDPVALFGGGSFNFDYPNVMRVNNYYQRNPTDHLFQLYEGNLATNPFQGSPVSGNFQWPVIRNVNYTGNLSINHINITQYAIKHF
jgi:RHS repeat-associated protein